MGGIVSTVQEALTAYHAAVDECRRAEYAKQQAAQALYEARQVAGASEGTEDVPCTCPDDPLPDTAFEHAIAYVDVPTKDGRKIASGGIDWGFGKRVPVTSGFEDGQIIGYAIPSHIDEAGAVMASVYIEEDTLRLITPLETSISLGIGLDNTKVSIEDDQHMTVAKGRLRQVAAQPAESAAWPGTVVNHG